MIYDPQIFTEQSLNLMKQSFRTLVSMSKADATAKLSSLPQIPAYPSLPIQIVEEVRAGDVTPRSYLHQAFDMQASSDPSRIALESAELRLSMTYGELQQSSNIRAQCRWNPVKAHCVLTAARSPLRCHWRRKDCNASSSSRLSCY